MSNNETNDPKELYNKGLQAVKNKDYEYALNCFERSVWLGGPPEAGRIASQLLVYYITGKKDYYNAFFYMLHAARCGDAQAMEFVSFFYDKEDEPFCNMKYPPYNMYTANVWLEKAVNAGNVNSCATYSYRLMNGIGCAQDIYKAKDIALKGAERGNTVAMLNLVSICEGNYNSLGFDADAASFWLEEAAKRGNQQAINHLNKNYFRFGKKWIKKS